jgi:hypothetical protein
MSSVRIPSLVAAALAATLIAVPPLPAGAGPNLQFRVGGHLARLLAEPAVQQELHMTAQQISNVQRRMPDLLLIGDTPPEPEQAEAEHQRRMAAFEQAVAGILSEDQLKRARQLSLQLEGAPAFARAEVADPLQLTPEQRKQVAEILRTSEEKMRAVMEANIPGSAPPAAIQAAITQTEAIQKAADKVLLGLLTDTQQQRWKSLMGQPFQFPQSLVGGQPQFGTTSAGDAELENAP